MRPVKTLALLVCLLLCQRALTPIAGCLEIGCLSPLGLARAAEDAPQHGAQATKDSAAQSKAGQEAEEPDPPPADIFGAAKSGNLKAVEKFLLDNPRLLNAKTELGDTPLHWAVSCAHQAVVRCLLNKSADVNARNISGSTPLHLACRIGNKAIAELLIAAKADVNAKAEDDNDETPLHIVVRKSNIGIVELLLQNHAAVEAKLQNGQTPMDSAKKVGRRDIMRLLKKYGAADNDEE